MSRKPDPDAIWDCRNPDSKPSQQLAKARFCFIPGAAATDNRLKLLHWRFLAYIGRQNADHGWLRISQTNLAEEWGCNRSTLNTSIRDLVKWGYIDQTTQGESGDTWCCYRIRMDGPTGVSDTGDTPEVSGSDNTGVGSGQHGCTSSGNTQGVHSLYTTDHPDKPDPHASHGGDAQARPAPDVEQVEVVQPEKPKRQRKPKATKVDLLGEPVQRNPRNTKVPFPDDIAEELVAYGIGIGMSEEDAKASVINLKLDSDAKARLLPNWMPYGQKWLINDRDRNRKRANGARSRHANTDDAFAMAFGS